DEVPRALQRDVVRAGVVRQRGQAVRRAVAVDGVLERGGVPGRIGEVGGAGPAARAGTGTGPATPRTGPRSVTRGRRAVPAPRRRAAGRLLVVGGGPHVDGGGLDRVLARDRADRRGLRGRRRFRGRGDPD